MTELLGHGVSLAESVDDWLIDQALAVTDVAALVEGCSMRLVSVGVPLARSHVSHNTLHPLFASQSITWRRNGALETTAHGHGAASGSGWLQSPLYYMIEHRLEVMRRRLTGPDAVLDYPVLEQLRDQGLTDYLAFTVPFSPVTDSGTADGMVSSWCCDRASGFSDSDIALLLRVQRRLALACKVQIKESVTRNILATYLGRDAGERVARGQIQRGDGETVHAVIWYSDMRRSTELAEQLGHTAFMDALNSYFECSAGAVIAGGGEVLRFVGDAVLGIFPVRDGEQRAPAANAVRAARDARRRLERLNARRTAAHEATVDFGLGLHVGEVMFGNIGIPERLEFSVTGPAANLVARLEDLTKRLEAPVLMSGSMAALLHSPPPCLGQFELRGVGEPVAVHALGAQTA